MSNMIEHILEKYPIMILDGALATELEKHGCNLDDPLWSARVLLDQPEIIYKVHLDYYRAGADCAITSSYQATIEGFKQRGLPEEQALLLIAKTVELAKQARDDFWQEYEREMQQSNTPITRPQPIVAGSIGPYGAFLADGSEYTGHYNKTDQELIDFHYPRMKALVEAGADVLAMETIPSFQEAKVLAGLLAEYPEMCAWISFSMKDDQHISEGTLLTECAQWFEDNAQIAAIGLNCTPANIVTSAIQVLSAVSDKPIIVYPNSGEKYDASTKTWHQAEHSCDGIEELDSQLWYAAGASIIGGCCRTSPSHIEALAKEWRG